MGVNRKKSRSPTTTIFLLLVAYLFLVWLPLKFIHSRKHHKPTPIHVKPSKDTIHLSEATERYPVTSHIPLPKSRSTIPRIQYDFPKESRRDRKLRTKRQNAVKEAFMHSWNGYKDHAWLRDEVSPKSGRYQDSFSGWGATLVDSLDALVIMGLDDEFQLAVEALEQIDFSTTFSDQVNVFEIIIRYMGGFIAANDLTDGKHPVLIKKAEELGDMIFNAFDTHNRMPQMRWDWAKSAQGEEIRPSEVTSLAELGSLTVEFTRLSQVTGNPKYFDAIQRITNELERSQMSTNLPGLWPTSINADLLTFTRTDFTLGGSADSTYEYLAKEHILLGGQTGQYRDMYTKAIEAIKKDMLFRAMTKEEDRPILFTANARVLKGGSKKLTYVQEHLKCFLGGTVGLAAKVFNRTEDLAMARGLTDGCVWAYDQTATGIMPESMIFTPCEDMEHCSWDESLWYGDVLGKPMKSREHFERAQRVVEDEGIPPGIAQFPDPSYRLRPEAVESVFIMYRITGDRSYQDTAWRMFQNIDKATRTKYGHSSIEDVRNPLPRLSDKMESFWLAETLKYFYLIFSTSDLISLDDYVLSTEAHPFKRPGHS